MQGTVIWYNVRRSYGFVETEDGSDAFVHRNNLNLEAYLERGDRVEFDLRKTPKGLEATSVRRV